MKIAIADARVFIASRMHGTPLPTRQGVHHAANAGALGPVEWHPYGSKRIGFVDGRRLMAWARARVSRESDGRRRKA